MILAAFGYLAFGASAAPKTYVCDVKQMFVITEKGVVGKSDYTRMASQSLKQFAFDERTGELRWAGTEVVQRFSVRQIGTDQNGMVAVVVGYDPAGVIYDMLRIKTYNKVWTFTLDSGFDLMSGICR